MEWSAFRNGTPLELTGGERVGYDELEGAGFPPFYIRVMFRMISGRDVSRATVDGWLAAGADPRRMESVKDELRAFHESLQAPAESGRAGSASGRTGSGGGRAGARGGRGARGASGKRAKRERLYPMVSRTRNTSHARREAEKLGLRPAESRRVDPASGEESVRLTVDATKQQATTLTLSGFWMHRPKDEPQSAPKTSARARVRSRRPKEE